MQLQGGDYDIIHYSGHGLFCETPENSSLFFWEKYNDENGRDCISAISATELNTLVERTKIKFIYLSCCQGAMVGPIEKLLNNDFLGISHSLLVSGVPAVMAMRWPLSDEMAILLADSFYKELFKGNGLEVALYCARKRVQSKAPNDYTWLSPILIVQDDSN
jgi:CHAT domain-containing protein